LNIKYITTLGMTRVVISAKAYPNTSSQTPPFAFQPHPFQLLEKPFKSPLSMSSTPPTPRLSSLSPPSSTSSAHPLTSADSQTWETIPTKMRGIVFPLQTDFVEVVKNTKLKRASEMSRAFLSLTKKICMKEGEGEETLDSLIDFFLLLESYFVNSTCPILVAVTQVLERASHTILLDFKGPNPSTFYFLVNVKYTVEVGFSETPTGLQTICFKGTTLLVARLTARLSSYFTQASREVCRICYHCHN
jgi:hypothetical protein